jgi:sec-independent protein translocase protein TatC
VKTTTLRKGRRYAIPMIFIVAAILTPGPDPISQFLMAVPLCLLYELGIWVSVAFESKKSADEEAPEDENGEGETPAG